MKLIQLIFLSLFIYSCTQTVEIEKTYLTKKIVYQSKNILGFESPFRERIVSFFKDEPIVGGYINAFYLILIGFLHSKFQEKNKNIKNCKAYGKNNPITGQHVEIICETKRTNKDNQKIERELKSSFKKELLEGFVPLKIKFKKIEISYRFKKLIN